MTARQRRKLEAEEAGSNAGEWDESLLALPMDGMGSKRKKKYTAEEEALRRIEQRQKRKNLSSKKDEAIKRQTIEKLLRRQTADDKAKEDSAPPDAPPPPPTAIRHLYTAAGITVSVPPGTPDPFPPAQLARYPEPRACCVCGARRGGEVRGRSVCGGVACYRAVVGA
ncbi:hypothetical protein DFJ74DRAFT_668892 [Hyaloraphidium curvatum]|nr:hypothetical protein DFJ74DRAFT_668892 [Hyaloraphidium curvatum]